MSHQGQAWGELGGPPEGLAAVHALQPERAWLPPPPPAGHRAWVGVLMCRQADETAWPLTA